MQQYHVQTAVVGAGVIGLSVARALSMKGHEVLLIEQEAAVGSGISSRNSEVIHAGIYYDKRTMPLKSQFCVEGKKMLYNYCEDRHIPYRRCGKLLVATDGEQRDVGLPGLVEYAKANGVDDLQILSKQDVFAYEPSVVCTGGVLSPSTGVIDSHALMLSLLADAEEYGATLALQCRVKGGRPIPANSGEKGAIGLDVDGSDVNCDNVIVCAGLGTDGIVSSIQTEAFVASSCNRNMPGEEAPHTPRQYYAKGNYFKLENQKSPFSRLIYPLPDPRGGLGVHATIDLSGSTRFGPDVEWLDDDINDPEGIDMNVDPSRAESFYDAVRKYWPDLEDGNLVPDYAGVRPKLFHPSRGNGNDLKDFHLAGPDKHKVRGLTVLSGIESPGLTSSLAIADFVAETIA